MPLELAVTLYAPSPAVPESCRNESSSVVLRQALTSTGVSSRSFENNYLEMLNCLREAVLRNGFRLNQRAGLSLLRDREFRNLQRTIRRSMREARVHALAPPARRGYEHS